MKYFLMCVLICAITLVTAQKDSLKKKVTVSLSYGLPGFDKNNFRTSMQNQLSYLHGRGINTDASISYSVKGFGPVSLKIDFPITRWLSAGPVLAYSQASIQYRFLNPDANSQTGFVLRSTNTELNTYSINSFVGGLRVNFHLGKTEKTDPYIGMAIGYKYTREQISRDFENPFFGIPRGYTVFNHYYESPEPTGPLYFALSFGVREYVSKNFGILMEAGLDNWSYVQAGFVLKMN